MTVTIDKVGRLVVPKEFRDQMSIAPDTELEIIQKARKERQRQV